MFASEEPTHFGVDCFGSHAMAGALTPADILELQDEDSHNPDEIRRKLGFTGNLEDVQVSKDAYHAFVKLHIKQGPELE